jgi:ammonium transporter, Amt family
VAICSPANAIDPWAGALLGMIGAVVCQCQVLLFENVLHIDDPLAASSVHFGAGAAGMVMTAFLANPDYSGEDFAGIFYGGEWKFLGNQLFGMLCYTSWTVATTGVMFYAMKAVGWLRISEEEELIGVDVSHHGGSAYPMDDEHDLKKDKLTSHPESDGSDKEDVHVVET